VEYNQSFKQCVYLDQVAGLLCHNMHVTWLTDSTLSRAVLLCIILRQLSEVFSSAP
jgi:hypothetical protein